MAEEFSQETENTENTDEEVAEIIVPAKRSLIARLGCWVLVVIWIALLLTPCAFFYLAQNGEIRIWHSDIPEPDVHPRLLISLVSEIDDRGLRITNSTIVDPVAGDDMLCVQTNVRFVFWQSKSDNQDAVYCECYQGESVDGDWTYTETAPSACQK